MDPRWERDDDALISGASGASPVTSGAWRRRFGTAIGTDYKATPRWLQEPGCTIRLYSHIEPSQYCAIQDLDSRLLAHKVTNN